MALGTLYVVATPLGHLGDLTARASEVLRDVSLVAAEDTRRTRVLLASLGSNPTLLSYHAHSPPERAAKLIEVLLSGTDVALVTDAGTPALSDPGAHLTARARNAGIPVVPIPGPSAITTLLSVAGLPADRFVFVGFLPRRGAARRILLDRIAQEPWTTVLFESPNRLVVLLEDVLANGDPNRLVVVGRELTKMHEDIRSGALTELIAWYTANPPRGEVTVALAGVESKEPVISEESLTERIDQLLADGMPRREIAREIMAEFGMSRNAAYARVQEHR